VAVSFTKQASPVGKTQANSPSNFQSAYKMGISCLGKVAQADNENFLRFSLYLTHG
jgi:hypothetical protein